MFCRLAKHSRFNCTHSVGLYGALNPHLGSLSSLSCFFSVPVVLLSLVSSSECCIRSIERVECWKRGTYNCRSTFHSLISCCQFWHHVVGCWNNTKAEVWYIGPYFSPFAKRKQAEVWQRFQSLLQFLLWTEVLNASENTRQFIWEIKNPRWGFQSRREGGIVDFSTIFRAGTESLSSPPFLSWQG